MTFAERVDVTRLGIDVPVAGIYVCHAQGGTDETVPAARVSIGPGAPDSTEVDGTAHAR